MLGKLATMCIVVLLLAGIVIAAWGTFGMTSSPLTLSIGSGPIALVQNGPLVIGGYTGVSPTLTTSSTPGTALVAVLIGDVVTAAPSGWVQLASVTNTFTAQVWVYLNNPGGILAPRFTVSVVSSTTDAHISEWSNVLSALALETSGTATTAAGSTLTPTAGAAIINPGDLVLAAWGQTLAAPGTVTFTSPAGYARLKDNGATSAQGHDDIEYLIGPQVGATPAPILTSSGTTSLAAGFVIVLRAAPPAVDMTAYLKYD